MILDIFAIGILVILGASLLWALALSLWESSTMKILGLAMLIICGLIWAFERVII